MPRTRSPGGRRTLLLNDWPYGAPGRRRLLEALLQEHQPAMGWTKAALEGRAQVKPGGLDEVLAGALQFGLLERDGERWKRSSPLPPIAKPLRALLRQTARLPASPIEPFPRRPYTRGAKEQHK